MVVVMNKFYRKASTFLCGAAVALVASVGVSGSALADGNAKALDEKAVIEILRAEIARDPTFIFEALNSHMAKQQAMEQRKLDEQAVKARQEMAESDGRPFVGAKDASVELVYFFDTNCGYCKRLEPVIARIVEENGDVRVSHREIPILSESSRSAAVASHVVWQMFPDKYEAIHESFMGHQGPLDDDVIGKKLVEVLGSDDAEKVMSEALNADSDIMKSAVEFLEDNLALAQRAGVTGTPFVYVLQGDVMMRGAGDDAYQKLMGYINDGRNKQ